MVAVALVLIPGYGLAPPGCRPKLFFQMFRPMTSMLWSPKTVYFEPPYPVINRSENGERFERIYNTGGAHVKCV